MTKTKSLSLNGVVAAAALALGLSAAPQSASAQDNNYVGEIFPVGFNFCPRGTAALNGQLLAISSNDALFSLLGTNFGGDGRTTFALPDLRGRSPMQIGAGPGLTPRTRIGQRAGATTTTATTSNLATHSHLVGGVEQTATKRGPGTDFFAISSDAETTTTYAEGPADVVMDTRMILPTGGNQAMQIAQPYLVVNWCINLFGVYPSRS